MDIFRSVTQTVLGSQQPDTQPNGAETVERLLDRVQSSTLLEDRRDGCRALKSLSRKYRLLVGAHGMDTLTQVLESDRSDHEIVNYALESLVNVTSNEDFTDEDEEDTKSEANCKVGVQFTEIFVKRLENIALIMSLLDEFDFKIRYPAMKLLGNLLENRPKELQEAILVTPNGVSKLMDMLSDSREVIRNDTLLLLTRLTHGNTNLQKIVVFENAYDHLFEIMREEGFAEGGVVVEDCLMLMLNLLKNNPSNQTLFKEGTYIQKMIDFFNIGLENEMISWSPQKIATLHYMLKLLRTLVSPQNSAIVVSSCQKKMKSCGLLERLCALLMAIGVPADILSDTIVTVAELIRGNHENQEYFSSVTAPSSPPRPVIVVLLMSMANDKQPFALRCAVLYCFQCFLYRNPSSQAQIVHTLLPQTTEATQVTSGQLLCGGLFSSDFLSNWFSAVALSHALLDNTSQKEQLLRVQLSTGAGEKPVSLLQQCASRLQASNNILTRFGILQLLSTWLSHCPIAVTHLLSLPGVIPNLTAYLSANEHDELEILCQGVCAFLLGLCVYFNDDSVPAFSKESLMQLISNRVGAEAFSDKVDNILRAEAYSRAAKSPHLSSKVLSEVVFDHEFTKLYKLLEGPVLRAVTPQVNGGGESTSVEVIRYKDIIRDQDQELNRLKKELQYRDEEIKNLTTLQQSSSVNNLSQHIQLTGNAAEDSSAVAGDRLTELEQQLAEMTYARDYYYYQMVEKDAQLQNQTPVIGSASINPDLENLRKQLEDLQLILYKKDEELQQVRNTQVHSNFNSKEDSRKRLEDLETQLRQKEVENENLRKKDANKKCLSLEFELKRLQSEQEDLLVLLTDQETKLSEMRKSLKNYGEVFSDDDDEDDDDIGIDPHRDPNDYVIITDSDSEEDFSLA